MQDGPHMLHYIEFMLKPNEAMWNISFPLVVSAYYHGVMSVEQVGEDGVVFI